MLYFGTFVNTVYYNSYDIDAMSLMIYYVGIFRRAVGSRANAGVGHTDYKRLKYYLQCLGLLIRAMKIDELACKSIGLSNCELMNLLNK